ncbi:MAG: hypothetical protein Q4Q53_03955 [Methanocorpusculum sp.]|nr:hypothetical protein [Methanocorpusculum sp.]
MKKLICLLAIFLLCAACVSGVSAFTYDSDAVVNPSGSLSPGETVTASMIITIPKGSITSAGSLTLTSDLVDPIWTYDIYIGSDPRSLDNKGYGQKFTISGWSLDYGDKGTLEMTISVTGKVSNLGISPITVMSILQTPSPSGEFATYSTPNQIVYNPNNYESDVASLESRASELQSRITTYLNYSIDVKQAESYLTTAKSKISTAKSYGKSDITNAYANIEAADEQLDKAEYFMAGSALNFIKYNSDKIKEDIAILEEKGWKNEAALIASSNQGIINLYTLAKATYDAGSVPDVDTNLADSFTTLAKANGYVESANSNPLAGILGYWWILLIVAGAVIVAVGVVFFLKRRGGSWDELG